ncbi:MAG: hypothetical protein QMD85_02020, partial [Candidatus Aenigmarchaeota archaeon]|nr:hypothetical protein [Candidatus Aenigmarchaeota archaeon]MDI6722326.1 hypothetical protein [Candidatus Aenigmarchaeota archaeon]
MALSDLIRDLKEAAEEKKLSRQDMDHFLEGRVVLPDDFDNGEVKLEDMNFGNKHTTSLYHVLISDFPKMTLDEAQPVIDGVFRKSKDLKLGRGVA